MSATLFAAVKGIAFPLKKHRPMLHSVLLLRVLLLGVLRFSVLSASTLAPVTTIPAPPLPEPAQNVRSAGSHDWITKHPTIERLASLTNSHRSRSGRAPVALNPELCVAAQRHATWMARTGIYRHSSLPYREIIFRGPTTADAAVRGWIYSPAHHGILLSGRECGFGYMKRNGVCYWVGVFR